MKVVTTSTTISDASGLNAEVYEGTAALREYDKTSDLFPVEQQLISKYFSPKEEVLDIGCGAGRTTYNLLTSGFKVIAVDLSEKLVEAARARCPGACIYQADVRSLPFEDNLFAQALFSFNGLDHVHPIEDYIRALKEINRVLKPGGVLIYSGHNIFGRFGRHLRSLREFISVSLKVHPKYLLLQLRGSQVNQWYWRYHEPFGEVVAFSAPPYIHKRLQRKAGFELLAICGQDNNNYSETWLTWREHHVYYVVRKS